ncbi:MAG: prepilin-type N-terminal cleavage/methylation domain-containing protein [Candidatus Saccharibacteria bacterium]|nr:prepilin-type N-terminal cleavage/methylation domain-containing protein [Candidatus Saccharibacteria bacterium]
MKKLTNQFGFSLIELLIVVAVFSFAAGSIISLFMGIQGMQRRAEDLESARHAAELKIESLRNIHYNNLEPDETIDFTSELPNDLPEPNTGTVEVSEPSPGLRRVNVTVSYNNGPEQREVRLSSIIGAIGITQ